MNFKYYLLIIIFFSWCYGFSQNMQEGFNYLETGKYKAAESYFKTILEEYPDNKTAKLCYGRAVGLQGDSKNAVSIFINLLKSYPEDFEIKLNYAESLLWNKQFIKAKTYYKDLVEEDSKSFPALLGYANTLSNLKIYAEALDFVNKALEISPGNQNAMVSKKYIYLGYAYQNQQQQNYKEAEVLLKENLKLFENDKETVLNLANLYLISNQLEKARSAYNTIANNPDNRINALNGLALVSHLNNKEKDALHISKQAYDAIGSIKDAALVRQTQERYIQALIWNNKYKAAENLINELMSESPAENWILALRATLNIYKSDFKKSVSDYNQILENDSTSFDGNLGKANALKALGFFDDAYTSAYNTLKFYDNQKDATNFIEELNTSFTPFMEIKTPYSFDNGNNEAFSIQNMVEFPLTLKFKVLGNYSYRSTNNTVTNNKATSNDLSVGLSYQLLSNITFKGTAGIISARAETDNYTQFLTDISFNIKPFKLQVLDVGYKREIQNFNADLLDKEIVMNNFYANYNISTNFKLGWFTQYYYTSQNDDNTRNLLFTSLYYNILRKPILKSGINFQYITFKNQVPTIYFSPKKFKAYEVFVDLLKDENIAKNKEWFYGLNVAAGMQYIKDDNKQGTYRFQGKLGYKFSERCLANLYGTHSNIASATAAGFTYTEIGLRFKWYLFKNPVFLKSN